MARLRLHGQEGERPTRPTPRLRRQARRHRHQDAGSREQARRGHRPRSRRRRCHGWRVARPLALDDRGAPGPPDHPGGLRVQGPGPHQTGARPSRTRAVAAGAPRGVLRGQAGGRPGPGDGAGVPPDPVPGAQGRRTTWPGRSQRRAPGRSPDGAFPGGEAADCGRGAPGAAGGPRAAELRPVVSRWPSGCGRGRPWARSGHTSTWTPECGGCGRRSGA